MTIDEEAERADWEYEQMKDRRLDELWEQEQLEKHERLRQQGGDHWKNENGEPRYG